MDWLTCGPVGRSLRRRWIYIQRPTFFFNLSSSSPSAAETACSSLRRPTAFFCAPQRNATRPTARPSLHSAPPVILCRVQAHPAPEPVKFPTPLRLLLHCRVFPISELFQSGASPFSIVLGALDTVWSTQQTRVFGRWLYVRS